MPNQKKKSKETKMSEEKKKPEEKTPPGKEMTPQKQITQSKKASPETQSWHEHMWRETQQTPNRLEDAAKFLATMISVSLSLFLALGKTTLADSATSITAKVSIGLWVLSLIGAFLVLFPRHYPSSRVSVELMKKAHKRITRYKYWLLAASSVLFLAALSIMACLYFFGTVPCPAVVLE